MRIETVMISRCRAVIGSFLFMRYLRASSLWRVRFGLSQRQIGHIPLSFSHLSIELSFSPVILLAGLFTFIFSHFSFIHTLTHSLMRHTLHLPGLSFEPGTIVFSPGIRAIILEQPSFVQVLDQMMEFHLATDFGFVTRSMRFDNTLAALMGAGQLRSRYFIPSCFTVPERLVIITTHQDQGSTTIRFPSEQE